MTTGSLPRSFWFLWSSQAVSMVGSALQLIVLPLWIYDQTGSAISTGLSFAVQFVPLVVLAPWAGHVVDRFDRRRLMVLCELLSAATLAGLVVAMRADQVAAVYALLPVLRTFNALTMPAYQALSVALVPVALRPKSATLMEAIIGANNALAPLLGTVLAARFGYELVLLVNLVSFLVGAALLRGVPATPSSRRDLGGVLRSTATATRVFVGNRVLGRIALAEAGYFLFFGADLVLVLLIAKNSFGTGPAGVAAAGAGTGWFLTATLVVRRFKHRPHTVMAVSALATPAAAVLVVAVAGAGPAALFLAAMSLGAVNVAIAASATIVYQQEVTEDVAGRVFALRRALLNSMLALSYLMLPLVAAAGPGNGPTLVLAGVLTAAAVLAGVAGASRAARHRRSATGAPADRPAVEAPAGTP